jgi:hypothetical protein
MAHFAQLDNNNIVTNILVVANEDILDDNGQESESKGIEFLKNLFGEDTNWIQTSYNNNFRKRYAGLGSTYDSINDVFINQKPYNSWLLDETTYDWKPPVPAPVDNENRYYWNEETTSWDIITE